MTHPQRILIVSDQARSDIVRDALAQRGFQVMLVKDFNSAYRELLRSFYALVVVELTDGTEGVEFIERVRATAKRSGILILAVAEWGTGAATLALSKGADGYEPGPLEGTRLLAWVERLLSRQAVVIE